MRPSPAGARQGREHGLLRELWPAARQAYASCLSAETDGDGIIENTVVGLGAIELGELREGIHQDIYLAAIWIEALRAMAEMAESLEQEPIASEARGLLTKAERSLNEKYWLEESGYLAFGILQSGPINDTRRCGRQRRRPSGSSNRSAPAGRSASCRVTR